MAIRGTDDNGGGSGGWSGRGGVLGAIIGRLRGDERLVVICGSTVLVMAGQGVVGPVLPIYARDFGVSTAVVGLTFTAFGLARLLLNIPAGIWADRAGRRFLLVGGPIVTSIGMIGSGLAPTIWALLAWRLVAGAGSALYMTGAQIYLIDIAADDERARYIATNQGALLVGVSVGPAVGGLLADSYGLRVPFLVVGIGAAITAVYGFFRLPETRESTVDEVGTTASSMAAEPIKGVPGGEGVWATRRAFARSNQFVAVGLVSFAIFSLRSGFRQTLVPIAATDRFGLDTGDLGLLFTALGVIGLVLIGPAGWVADRWGRKPAIVPSGYVAAAGVALTAVSGNLTWFVAGLVLSAIGTGVGGPAPAAFVADISPPELRGAAMGLYRTWGDLGMVAAPVLSGALADVTSMRTSMLVSATVIAAAITWFQITAREPTGVGLQL
ncbi:MAG: MFS transporter [Actinomycetia bacterium]|nr:MFS transporter [Actinomycetes bacterium]